MEPTVLRAAVLAPGSDTWRLLVVLGGLDPDAGYTVEAISPGAWSYRR